MNNSDDISRKLLAAERAAALTSLLESHDAHVAKKRLEVVVLGLNVVDVLVRLPGKVRPGEKYEVRDLARARRCSGGQRRVWTGSTRVARGVCGASE